MQTDVLLIDGSSFVFRAFYAIPKLNAPDGHPTNATYGVINMLRQMQKKYSAKYWVCVFDAPGKTFRDELHPEYKATRSKTPPELVAQLNDIYTLVDVIGIPVIIKSGFEADDIIATIAVNCERMGKKVVIATGDKDFAQLVNQNIILVNTMTDQVLDIDGVYNKFGVYPYQIVDYLSLVGDKVDNIMGITKCGHKTAIKWLTEYKTIDNIIANADEIKGPAGDSLRQSLDWLKVARKLITLDTNVLLDDIDLTLLDNFICRLPDYDRLIDFYTRFGFKSWLKEAKLNRNDDLLSVDNDISIPYNTSTEFVATEKQHIIVNTPQELQNIINQLDDSPIGIVCVADNYLKPQHINYLGFANSSCVYLVNNTQKCGLFDEFASYESFTPQLISLFESSKPKYLVNLKETLQLLTRLGILINNVVGDLTLVHYIRNSKNQHNVSAIFSEYLGLNIDDLPSFNLKLAKNSVYNSDRDNDKLTQLSIIAHNVIELTNYIMQELSTDELKLYQDVELPLASILVKIENNGIMLNNQLFKTLEYELMSKIKALENNIYQLSGTVFNINSPKQLQDVLFNQLKLSTTGIKKTDSGYSTNEDTLQILAHNGIMIANHLLEYRMLSKLLNTYVNKLPNLTDKNHRLHTTFEQALVASGRLSSRDPNLQNIPIKNSYGKLIRSGFISPAGYKLVCADYSQIELRILAVLSQDENLICAFNTNQDIHSITASEIFHKPISEVNSDERRYAKTINFSLIYGKTVFGLAQELGIDRAVAKLYIDTYFAKYPKVMTFLDEIKSQARNNGYVTTIFGRRVYLPNINHSNRIIRDQEERLALNAPMQGSAADIIKMAMININNWLVQEKLDTRLILQVHDELIFEVPDCEVDLIKDKIIHFMENVVTLSVKMKVEINVANNWNDAH